MKNLLLVIAAATFLAAPAPAQGPVVLMGIDAEDCGPGGHGPITVYRDVVDSILAAVTKAGTTNDILVIGGTATCIDPFWNALVAINPPLNFTRINGGDISTTSFAPYRLVVVSSDFINTPGGLTNAENDLLTARASDIATHINVGGGLLGFSSCALQSPYAYFGQVGAITCGTVFESLISPTPAGAAVGITTALNVCCWHDSYTAFPGFLDVLATYPNVNNLPAALGGVGVTVPGFVLTPGSATNPVGTFHTKTITVTQTPPGGSPTPVPGVLVDFVVTGVNPTMGSCTTDANGQCDFTWFGTNFGDDTVTATAVVAGQNQMTFATKTWEECHLLVGLGGGPATGMQWNSGNYVFQTQLSGIHRTFPVLIDEIPSFRIPSSSASGPLVHNYTFSAQVVMFNPHMFPNNPEQWTHPIQVTVHADGIVTTSLPGNNNGMNIFAETRQDAQGQWWLRFPFTIDGL